MEAINPQFVTEMRRPNDLIAHFHLEVALCDWFRASLKGISGEEGEGEGEGEGDEEEKDVLLCSLANTAAGAGTSSVASFFIPPSATAAARAERNTA